MNLQDYDVERTIDMPALTIRASLGTVRAEDRSVELVFSTGAGVTRMDPTGRRYIEKLSLNPAHVRLERLNAGAPLLDSHVAYSVDNVIGSVVPGSARVKDGEAVCTVRFSRRDNVEPIWQDVRDEIIRAVSVGYLVHKYVEDAGKDGKMPTRTAIDWEPYETSLVPMAADAGAKVRGDEVETNECELVSDGDPASDAGDVRTTDEERNARFERLKQSAPPAPVTDPATERRRLLESVGIIGRG